MGLSFLSGHHVVPTFTALTICGMWVALAIRRRAARTPFAVFAAVTALIAAVAVLPALEYSRQAIRWAGGPAPILPGQPVPFSVHAEYSLAAGQLVGMVWGNVPGHANPFVGVTALVLAVFALTRGGIATRWLAAFALCGLLISIARDFPPYWLVYRFVPMVEKAREPAFAIVLAQAGIAVLAALGATRLPGWAAALALVLFFGEAVYHAPHLNRFDRPGSYANLIQSQTDLIAYLKQQPGWFRVDFDDAAVPYNAGDLYGIEQFGGAVSSMPVRTHRMLGHPDTPRVFGIRYRVGTAPSREGQFPVFESNSGLKVFSDPSIREPIRAVRTETCPAADEFRLLSRLPERTTLEVSLGCPGLVVIGDAYYPGWRAFVDGRRTSIQEVDAVRAVRAQAGRHVIEFRYRPATVYWGFALCGLGVALTAWVCLYDFRKAGII
jgi:hypothetical protein